MKLEKLLKRHLEVSERDAKTLIVRGSVSVDGSVIRSLGTVVSRFDEIRHEETLIQAGLRRLYLMFHKPVGIVSATSDQAHETAIDLIDHPDKSTLHLAGRLDRSSSGLLLLSNDGTWSESLTAPANKVEKEYLVETDRPIPTEAVSRFREGFDFRPEGIRTRPASLELLSPTRARVVLNEGRYHQIKRMFYRINGIRLRSLHRIRIGTFSLPHDLGEGRWREITP
ncbi:MAG: pseudouridine synthase [Verrucomicrobiota bacterium]